MSDLIELGGLWAKKNKNGRSYLTGRLSRSVRILIFKNDFRTNENQPSHVMYPAPVEQLEGTGRPPETDEFLDDELEAPAANRAAAVRESSADEYSEAATRRATPNAPQSRPAPANAAPASRPRTAVNTARPSRQSPPPADDFADVEDPFADE